MTLVLSDIDECAESIDGCAQICTDTNGSYTCSCNPSYELASNDHDCDGVCNSLGSYMYNTVMCGLNFLDINECSEGTDGCDQLCTNNIGSYECVCNAGYRLASDGLTCYGIIDQ